MTRAILLIARWIAVAHDRWRAGVVRRRPLRAQIDHTAWSCAADVIGLEQTHLGQACPMR